MRKSTYKLFGTVYSKKETAAAVLFLLPALVLGSVFILLPIIISLLLAFTDAHMLNLNDINFVGLAQIKKAFSDEYLRGAFLNTLEFVVKVVPIQLSVALCLALLLNKKMRGNTFFRWAFFAPVTLSLAVTSFLWMNLLNEQEGLINAILGILGIKAQPFLSSEKQALNSIVFISAWQGAGYQMLIFLSGLKNIPQEMYEAAAIDGAGKATCFWRITLPLLKNTMSFVLITMLIGAFRLIVQPMIMTNGGPIDSTRTVSLYIYNMGIKSWNVGYSSAIALVYTVVIASVSLGLRRLLGEDKEVAK